MQDFFCLTIIRSLLLACSLVKIAVEDKGWEQKEELAVRGRTGFIIKQRLSFGEFYTRAVQRSCTKGSSWGFTLPVANDWVDLLKVECVRRKQTIRLRIQDATGNEI